MLLCRHFTSDKIVEVAELLLENGIDLKQTNKQGMNAFMLLCWWSRSDKIAEVVKLFIDKGIDVKQKDNKGRKAKDHFSYNRYLTLNNRCAIENLFLQHKHGSRVYLNEIIMDVTSEQDAGQYTQCARVYYWCILKLIKIELLYLNHHYRFHRVMSDAKPEI